MYFYIGFGKRPRLGLPPDLGLRGVAHPPLSVRPALRSAPDSTRPAFGSSAASTASCRQRGRSRRPRRAPSPATGVSSTPHRLRFVPWVDPDLMIALPPRTPNTSGNEVVVYTHRGSLPSQGPFRSAWGSLSICPPIHSRCGGTPPPTRTRSPFGTVHPRPFYVSRLPSTKRRKR